MSSLSGRRRTRRRSEIEQTRGPSKIVNQRAHNEFRLQTHITAAKERRPFESIALLLQGGGALGAYQAGIYEALAEADIHPDWIAGISIGAINAAIIAGNPPRPASTGCAPFGRRSRQPVGIGADPFADSAQGDLARSLFNQMSAGLAASFGASRIFLCAGRDAWLHPGSTLEATSFYETKLLKRPRAPGGFRPDQCREMRFSVGAVNVRTGNFVYFDTSTHKIRPEHVMASGALPPGFPAIEIEGEHYWDGGLISNTPLQWVIETTTVAQDTLAFQVDLWSARRAPPQPGRGRDRKRRSSIRAARAPTPTNSRACTEWRALELCCKAPADPRGER